MNPTKRVKRDVGSKNKTEQQDADAPHRATICAKDIMTPDVFTAIPSNTVHEIAKLMSEKRIGAVPVIDDHKIVGIVSEGDLIQREELGSATSLPGHTTRGASVRYAKSHGLCASDVMTRNVHTVSEFTLLAEIAEIMQTRKIGRLPVIRGTKIVGIVSRSNIVQTLAHRPNHCDEPTDRDDDIIRFKVIETLMDIPGTSPWLTTVDVQNGTVTLGGMIEDENALELSRAAVRKIPHVRDVGDHRSIHQPY